MSETLSTRHRPSWSLSCLPHAGSLLGLKPDATMGPIGNVACCAKCRADAVTWRHRHLCTGCH